MTANTAKKKAAAKAADDNIFSFDCDGEDENVYLSNIFDEAVRFYFEFVFSNNAFDRERK